MTLLIALVCSPDKIILLRTKPTLHNTLHCQKYTKENEIQRKTQKNNRSNIKLLSLLCCAVLSVILMVVIRYISKVLIWITTILVILGAVGT